MKIYKKNSALVYRNIKATLTVINYYVTLRNILLHGFMYGGLVFGGIGPRFSYSRLADLVWV